MMRVVIVGLKPAEASQIQREYRGRLRLRIFHSDTNRKAWIVADAATKADHTFVMTHFVAHKIIELLDNKMVTPIHGGMAKLREALNVLVKHLPTRPPKPVHKDVPHQEEPAMPRGAGTNDFSKLKTAKVGDVLVFKRPPTTSIVKFEKQVSAARSYHRNKNGVVTSQEFHDGEMHVLIEDRVAVGETKPPETTPPPETEEPKITVQYTDRPPTSPVPPHDIYRQFWMDVFLQSMRNRPSDDAHLHAGQANASLDALRDKFKEK